MMHHTEHAKEEVITLLEEQHDGYVIPDRSQVRRKKALRALLGVVGAVVLVAGAVVAVEMHNDKAAETAALSSTVNTMSLNTLQDAGMPPASDMEGQFGWSSIKNGWCSARAAAWCLFKSDKEKCKKEIHESCDSKPDDDLDDNDSGGSGSGSDSGSGSGSDDADAGDDDSNDDDDDDDDDNEAGTAPNAGEDADEPDATEEPETAEPEESEATEEPETAKPQPQMPGEAAEEGPGS